MVQVCSPTPTPSFPTWGSGAAGGYNFDPWMEQPLTPIAPVKYPHPVECPGLIPADIHVLEPVKPDWVAR